MIAALPMYDHPETAVAHDRLWALIRDAAREQGLDAPAFLNRQLIPWNSWEHADLFLGQACNLPMRCGLRSRVTLVATFDYALPGLAAGYYNSLFVVRHGDDETLSAYADRRLAYNDEHSHSG